MPKPHYKTFTQSTLTDYFIFKIDWSLSFEWILDFTYKQLVGTLLCCQGFKIMKIRVLPLKIFIGIILDGPGQVMKVMNYINQSFCRHNLKV